MDKYAHQNTAYYAAQYPYQQLSQYQPYQIYQPQQPSSHPTNPTLPPWRTNSRSMAANTGSARPQTRQVDSWRSYSTDASNLQSSTASTANLNAAAPACEPTSPSNTVFKPYESLRVSNGTAERKIVEAYNATQGQSGKARRKPKKKTAPLASAPPTDGFVSRYPVQSTRGIADFPLPSIETGKIAPVNTTLPIRNVNARQTRTKSPEAPVATLEYHAAARKQPVEVAEPRKLLVILDLNGTLLYRNRSAGTSHLRPGVAPFIDYIFEHHTVMVYTSATPEKAQAMVHSFLHPSHRKKLAGFWARDKLELSAAQYRSKVQVYKKLDKIWRDPAIQKSAESGKKWDQSNTILIDDSHLKALSQPHNLVRVPEYTTYLDPRRAGKVGTIEYDAAYKAQIDVMQTLQRKIEKLKYQEDVSRLIHRWQSGTVEVTQPATQSECTVVNQKTSEPTARTHLPTPESLFDDTDEGGVSLHPPEIEKTVYREKSGSVSSIDENVFKELLRGDDK